MPNGNAPRAEILRSRDFIGWAVTSSNGANVGTVSDVLIDRGGQVKYLAVDPGFFKKPYLLPVGSLEWGDGSFQSSWSDVEVRRLPPYDASTPLTGEVLQEMERAFPRHYGAHAGHPFEPGDGPSIVPLRDAKDFRLAKGAPNLKGWTVYGADNERVGVVTQMLVDPVGEAVRYLDVDVADDLFGLSDDRHVLVPLENVELRERSQDVWIGGLAAADVARLPAYLGGPVDPLVADGVGRGFAAPADQPPPLPAPEIQDAEFAGPPPQILVQEPPPPTE